MERIAGEERRASLVKFVGGRVRDERIQGKYAGRSVEASIVPANPPTEKRHQFVVEMDAGLKGASWRYLGGGAWTRPHDENGKVDPTLNSEESAVVAALEKSGVRPLLATLDLYRPDIRFDGARGRLVYRQAIPGVPSYPHSDTFAQILSVLRKVVDLNRAAQRSRR